METQPNKSGVDAPPSGGSAVQAPRGRITSVSYERLFTRVKFEDNAKIGAEMSVGPGEDPAECMNRVVEFVHHHGTLYLQGRV